MKKILSLLVLLVAFVSCEEDVKFNDPAVQGLKNNELWKAREFKATKSGNTIIVEATNGVETVRLTMNAPAPGSTHDLGVNELNKATYQLSIPEEGINEFYQTGTGLGNGEIVIMGEEYNNINGTDGKGYISGNFFFNAYTANDSVVNFQKGVFYKVPITVGQ